MTGLPVRLAWKWTSTKAALVAVALIALLSSGLLWWSAQLWEVTFASYITTTDNLQQARRAASKAYLLLHRYPGINSMQTRQVIEANLDNASRAARDAFAGHSSLLGIPDQSPAGALGKGLQRYQAAMERFVVLARTQLGGEQAPAGQNIALHNAYYEAERLATDINSQVQLDLTENVQRQKRIQAGSLVLWLLFLLGAFLLLLRSGRQEVAQRILLEQEQRALRESEAALQEGQALSHLGSWRWDFRADMPVWSDEMYRIFGCDPAQPAPNYKEMPRYFSPDSWARISAAVEKAIHEGEDYEIDAEVVRPDGSRRWVLSRGRPIRGAGGQIVELRGTIQDITERKRAEQSMRESTERLRALVDTIPDLIWMKDTDGVYMICNRRFESLFGAGESAIVGKTDYDFVDKKLADFFRANDQAAIAAGRPTMNEEELTFNSDGHREVVQTIKTPVYGEGGQVIGVLGIARDITQAKLAEQELGRYRLHLEELVEERTAALEAALAEARRLARFKSEFLANMSHEIRTPLNAVLGFARIGVRDSHGQPVNKLFSQIGASGEHLLGVINDILDYSKIEAGKLGVESTPFQLLAVIANASSFVAGTAKLKGIDYTSYLDIGLPEWVLGDAQRLQQILVNLLSNAVKFTDKGEVHLRVTRQGDVIRFSVADTGIGMDAGQLSRLFQPFEQADASTTRNFGGTGLGLAISRNLANLMGGEISVDSAPGRGSTFSLRLPLPATEPPVSDPDESIAGGAHRLEGIRVLAAEDVEVNQLILEDLLVHEGARVVFAGNGQEAIRQLEAAGAAAFDVVLMDVQMPVMDGYEATRRIRELTPRLPVIGLTAHAVAEERDKGHAAGMLEHVTKPIDIEELVSAILRHVQPMSPSAGHPGQAAPQPVRVTQHTKNNRLVDWAILLERFRGNREFIHKLAVLSSETYADSPASLRQLAQAGDAKALAFLAHRLKGSAGNLMAHELHALASQTEDAARAGLVEAFSLARELAEAVDRLLAELKDHLRQAGDGETQLPG